MAKKELIINSVASKELVPFFRFINNTYVGESNESVLAESEGAASYG